MLTAQTDGLLRRLKIGTFDPADVQALVQTSAPDFLADVESAYPLRFQERRLRNKWEVGLARTVRYQLVDLSSKGAAFHILVVVPVFRGCVFLSGEADTITGVSVATGLMVRPIRKPFRGLAMTTGHGAKLDRAPDGWDLKPLHKKTVKLTDDFLRARGWQFDVLHHLAARP